MFILKFTHTHKFLKELLAKCFIKFVFHIRTMFEHVINVLPVMSNHNVIRGKNKGMKT